ncbi:hypothetical protein L1887_46230 [Cichorium endivia]|nr:hypothetical protein L1887_46230 [Cichorium endivia]
MHALTEKQHPVHAVLQLPVQRTGHRIQMIALAGDVGLFQYHHFTPATAKKIVLQQRYRAAHTLPDRCFHPVLEIKTPGKAGRYVIKPCPAGAARPPAEAHLHEMLPA